VSLIFESIQLKEDKTKTIYSSEECQNVLQMWEEYYPKIGFHFPWIGYFVKRDNHIIGCCGFTGPPVNNRVEVSYYTFKQFEGQGMSTESCKKLISIAKQKDPSLIVFAKTAPEKK
jgi:ribosomal-protein-alanine N-acetyltransferase